MLWVTVWLLPSVSTAEPCCFEPARQETTEGRPIDKDEAIAQVSHIRP